jgi:hypothetical protein
MYDSFTHDDHAATIVVVAGTVCSERRDFWIMIPIWQNSSQTTNQIVLGTLSRTLNT